MSDPIPVQSTELVHERTVANLSPIHRPDDSLVRPSASVAQIEQAFRDYTTLCERLLVPDDYQQIGQKSFRKKSAWRKLATAFGVSVEMLWKEYERDGRHIIRAEVMSRAVAPNGRFMDGLGACDAFERCCEVPCKKASWNNHTCCTADCNGFVHFSKPNHDIPATAMTRATNRACADLFGMGEVSAEEVSGDEHGTTPDPEQWFIDHGWPDRTHHDNDRDGLGQRVAALPEAAKAAFKDWLHGQEFGWREPWPVRFANVVSEKLTELAASPHQDDEKAPSAPEPTDTPGAPSLPLPEPEKPTPKRRGTGGPLVKCAWCGADIKDEAAVPVTFHDKARVMHGRCKAEVDEEKKATGGIDPPF
jgi:hypothetical protein